MADYRQILRECAERLISTADRLTVNGSNTSQANRGSNAGTSQDCEPSALEEHSFQGPNCPNKCILGHDLATRCYIRAIDRNKMNVFLPASTIALYNEYEGGYVW